MTRSRYVPSARAVSDDLAHFLSVIDTAFLATTSADGQPYVQHRGGPKGFIKAIDEHTLGFVDFVGNRQLITTDNLAENDRVLLFLIDYERRRRVKVWGRARTVPATPEMLEMLTPSGYRARPQQIILIDVAAWDINCPQHIPQKLDAREVHAVVEKLQARIVELEKENAALRTVTA